MDLFLRRCHACFPCILLSIDDDIDRPDDQTIKNEEVAPEGDVCAIVASAIVQDDVVVAVDVGLPEPNPSDLRCNKCENGNRVEMVGQQNTEMQDNYHMELAGHQNVQEQDKMGFASQDSLHGETTHDDTGVRVPEPVPDLHGEQQVQEYVPHVEHMKEDTEIHGHDEHHACIDYYGSDDGGDGEGGNGDGDSAGAGAHGAGADGNGHSYMPDWSQPLTQQVELAGAAAHHFMKQQQQYVMGKEHLVGIEKAITKSKNVGKVHGHLSARADYLKEQVLGMGERIKREGHHIKEEGNRHISKLLNK